MLVGDVRRIWLCILRRVGCGGTETGRSGVVREWLEGGRSSGLMEGLRRLVGRWILRVLKI